MGFDSKCDFAPPTIFLGLLLCPWTWGNSSVAPALCGRPSSAYCLAEEMRSSSSFPGMPLKGLVYGASLDPVVKKKGLWNSLNPEAG